MTYDDMEGHENEELVHYGDRVACRVMEGMGGRYEVMQGRLTPWGGNIWSRVAVSGHIRYIRALEVVLGRKKSSRVMKARHEVVPDHEVVLGHERSSRVTRGLPGSREVVPGHERSSRVMRGRPGS